MSAPMAFDLEGPLPTGTSLLEASAGTGKTYAIARLVSRYLAEDVATIDRLLVVSFSEASSRELRDRVRERLVADRDAAAHAPPGSEMDRLAPRRLAYHRLDRALADFDGAMVTTIHAACQALLRELGTAADHDRDAAVLPDPSDLVDEVIADLYVARWGHADRTTTPAGAAPPPLPVKKFRDLARVAALDPATPLVPDAAEVDGEARLSVEVATGARAEVARRLRAGRLLTYDDMILRLDNALADPASADVALAHLRRRFAVVLVDEFQDTDPVQWRILRTAFHGHATLVLVGDPKQAIYGFRGADVHAYLDARRDATATATLPENHRSDPGVLEGLAALFGGAALGDPQIRVLPVRAALRGRRLDAGPPVRLRVLPREGLTVTHAGLIRVAVAREAIRDDVAREVVGLLSGGAVLTEGSTGLPEDQNARRRDARRRLDPGDIAVIVRTNAEAEAIRERLRTAGVPAVVSGRASVFRTPAAEAWLHLLEALEQPHRTGRVRRLAVGPLVGLTAETLESRLEDLALQIRGWLRVLEERGVAALAERVHTDLRLTERLLAQRGGERLLTDLRHIGEVLHEEALRSGLGLTALTSWLVRRRHEENDQTVERSRRLETDAAAVQVLTSHTSKGLEFPVVLAPSLWDYKPRAEEHPRFHDPAGRRVREVGGPTGPGHRTHVAANKAEATDEELRLAYVTLTRAAALAIAWWAPTENSTSAPLSRLLLHDGAPAVAPLGVPIPGDAAALARFRARADGSAGALDVQVVPVGGSPVGVWTPPTTSAPDLRLPAFDRGLDAQWRRTSYSALTAAAHEATRGAGLAAGAVVGTGSAAPAFGSEPEVSQKDDEVDVAAGDVAAGDVSAAGADGEAVADDDAHLHAVPSPWSALPGGTGFGTLVHRILERYAPGAGEGGSSARRGQDRDADLAALVRSLARAPGLDVAMLTDALRTAASTPLGPLAGGRSWADIGAADRLSELEFEVPLAGGDRPAAGSATLAGLAEVWRAHVPSGPLAGYADALDVLTAEGPATRLRGYLTGSIDAVVRMRGTCAGADPPSDLHEHDDERYVVVDYKTNRLAPPDEPLTAWHYRSAALERAMIDAHYPLQALLYTVALHRYLRWRRRGYHPERHLGGVVYLFLRGMCGPGVLDATGAAPGVFAWRPPAALVVATSDLLAGGAR